MDKAQKEEHIELLHKVLENLDDFRKDTVSRFEKADTQFQSLNLSITLIGADVDQLKRRVRRIEDHLDILPEEVLGN